MQPRDLLNPAPVIIGALAFAAIGFAAGFMLARDPERARRLSRVLADGLERATGGLAETREELTDLWASVTDEARRRFDDRVWSGATAGAAAAAAAADGEPEAATEPNATGRRPRSTRPRRNREAEARKT